MHFASGARRRAGLLLRVAGLAALAVTALTITSTGGAVVVIDGVTPTALPDIDARAASKPTAVQLRAAKALNGAGVTWNRYGTAGSVFNRHGYVATGIKAPTAAAAAQAWVRSHKQLFRLSSTAGLRLVGATAMRGTTHVFAVNFRQAFGGQLSADGQLTVSVVGTPARGWKIVYVSSTLTPGSSLSGARLLSPTRAWMHAAGLAGNKIALAEVTTDGKTATGWTKIIATGFDTEQLVRPIAFGTTFHGGLRAYEAQVTRTVGGNTSAYDMVVDAASGKLLSRTNLVNYAVDNPTILAYGAGGSAPATSPPYDPPYAYPSTDTRELWSWDPTPGAVYVAHDSSTVYPTGVASKMAWDIQPNSAGVVLTTNQTTGNNEDSIQRWNNSGTRTYGSGAHSVSATRDYTFPWTNAWYTSGCNPANLTGSGNDIDAAVTNLWAMHNRLHDFDYYAGWDEQHWNAQQYNNGITGTSPTPAPGGPVANPVGNDGVLGNAQSAGTSGAAPGYSGRNNANMSTGADGGKPTTNMFLWQPLSGSFYAPCVDGDYDMTVIGHEYGHAVENRMIGKGVGARQGNDAGAMGESFGDLNALQYLNGFHYAPVSGADKYTEGAYATGNHFNGIRNYLAGQASGGDLPVPGVHSTANPLNFSDYGYDMVGPEVHSDGDIWTATNINLRELMLARYPMTSVANDIACARGQVAVQNCAGDRRWFVDYMDGMVMMPRATTMLQARDAILAADLARYGANNNQDVIWQAFAMRGFGQLAAQTNNGDTDPRPDFSSPMANNATLTFATDAKDEGGAPVVAKIFVGNYEARVSQIADTDPATTPGNANLDNTAQFAPVGGRSLAKDPKWSTYNFLAVAKGYGFVRFSVKNLLAGETRNITIHFPTNYSSSAKGATATGDGTASTLPNVLDESEATNWSSTGSPVAGKSIVIKLGSAGTGVGIKQVGVSTYLVGCCTTQSRFSALRSFSAYSCRSGKSNANPDCLGSIAAGWTKIITSAANAFPGISPRPSAPELSYRLFDTSPQPVATHLKFVVDANQCTGNPDWQFDQDNDPANNSDCRVGNGNTTFPSRANDVRTTEIQVFGTKPTIEGAGPNG